MLLCTDGLTDMLAPDDISKTMAGDEPPAEKAEKLFWSAMDAGGKDNISLVLLCLEEV